MLDRRLLAIADQPPAEREQQQQPAERVLPQPLQLARVRDRIVRRALARDELLVQALVEPLEIGEREEGEAHQLTSLRLDPRRADGLLQSGVHRCG